MKQLQITILVFITLMFNSCVKEIELQSERSKDSQSIIVIEATITNELIQQEILLSRIFELDSSGPAPESNAIVKVIDDAQNEFTFSETETGKYISNTAFNAQPNRSYTLQVMTNDEKSYGSQPTHLTQATQIDSLYVERGFNENGDEGVSIFVNSFDPTGNSQFYRYTYDETYKIIAPYYAPSELIINNDDFPYPADFLKRFSTGAEIIEFFVIKQLREVQEQVCYKTVTSNTIILADATNFQNGRLEQFPVRFINRDNFILSHRYSILVKQHVQSREAHTFYETLKQFSESESLFSQTQPGFINGNMFSQNDNSEKVLGFFEVSTVNSKRVYFNYKDLFPDEILPPFYINCNYFDAPDLLLRDQLSGVIIRSPLQNAIRDGKQFWEDNITNGELNIGAPYTMVLGPCGDCTVLGSNIKPDFWVD